MEKKYLYIITLAYACSTFTQGILTPIYAFFVQKIGGSILEASWAIAIYSIITGVGTILIHNTRWSCKYRKQLFWGGWLVWLLSVAAYLVMYNTLMLYITEVFNGVGSAMCQPVFDAEFSKQSSQNLTGGWAIFEGITNIFYGVASIAGGFIVTWYGFNVLINCMILVAAVSFILIAYYTRNNFKESACPK